MSFKSSWDVSGTFFNGAPGNKDDVTPNILVDKGKLTCLQLWQWAVIRTNASSKVYDVHWFIKYVNFELKLYFANSWCFARTKIQARTYFKKYLGFQNKPSVKACTIPKHKLCSEIIGIWSLGLRFLAWLWTKQTLVGWSMKGGTGPSSSVIHLKVWLCETSHTMTFVNFHCIDVYCCWEIYKWFWDSGTAFLAQLGRQTHSVNLNLH